MAHAVVLMNFPDDAILPVNFNQNKLCHWFNYMQCGNGMQTCSFCLQQEMARVLTKTVHVEVIRPARFMASVRVYCSN